MAIPADVQAQSRLDAALGYANRGWAIFPIWPIRAGRCACGKPDCSDAGKHPLGRLVPHGRNDATTNADTLRAWWAEVPDANIGVATGIESDLIVLDLDDAVAENEARRLGLPPTFQAKTSKGQHVYFKRPDWPKVPTITQKDNLLGVGRAEIKADGGYVVAPPSVHATGVIYTWQCEHDISLTEPPTWLRAALWAKATRTAPDPPPAAGQNGHKPALDKGAQAMFRQQLDELAKTSEPGRNNALNKTAYTLGGLVGANRLDQVQVEDALLNIALSIGLEDRAAIKTIRSGLDSGMRKGLEGRPMLTIVGNGSSSSTNSSEPKQYNWTDYGNAERLVDRHGEDLRFCHVWQKWLVWDGRRWAIDDTAEVERRAKDTVRAMWSEMSDIEDEKKREKFIKWCNSSESAARIRNMLALAASELSIPVLPDELDADPMLLNCLNGVLDLRVGKLQPHDRALNITKLAPVAYDPNAAAPLWAGFLDRIMGSNQDVISFIQRAIGYSLTGKVGERVLFILHGRGRNGKSTLIETVRTVLGDYALRTPTETLMVKDKASIPNDVARLKGARYVSASESEEGHRLSESKIKDLTGGDTIPGRFLHGEFFEFIPEFKLWFATNHEPVIRGTDDGIWDRVRKIPFNVQIPENEVDKELQDKLKKELSGILTWAVQGCLDWQARGLGTPKEVLQATAAYREQMDTLGAWLDACCVQEEGKQATSAVLLESYKAHTGEQYMTSKRLTIKLHERGFIDIHTVRGTTWSGIGLKPRFGIPFKSEEK